jgi:PAS domain S-box-containing protein
MRNASGGAAPLNPASTGCPPDLSPAADPALGEKAAAQIDLLAPAAVNELLAAAPAMANSATSGLATQIPATPVVATPVPATPGSATPVPEATLAQALIESASVVIYHSNLSGNLTYVNPEYRRIFGLTPEQSTNDWVHGVHPDDRQRIEDAWEEFCRNPRAVRFDYRTKPVDGAVRYFTEQVVPARGVVGFVGTISDFTDLVTARGALLQQQTLLEAVITDLPIALLACDPAGNITHYNRAAVELHCVDADAHPMTAEVFLADGVTRVSPSDHPLMRALRGETISNLELVIQPRDTTARSTLVSARRLIGPDGQTLGAVAVIQDTTERKRAELELERVHKELMTASRQAGMAEVATNVLHNVGNILNSVNISASLVTERVKQSKAPGVTLLAELLKEQGADLAGFMTSDARGRRVPEYLSALGQQLTADQQMSLQELGSLRDNLEHIKETVSMQQSYAKLCGVTETVEVADLVEDSLRLNAGAFARHGVVLRREFAQVPPITVDKHKVLQILVNLVRNAKYACDESGRTDKLITLVIGKASDGVRISVIDNGVGILPENMDRLFTHGFTTRQSGHGFGLHSGALAAQELGGSLHAESDGPGRGAAFILELPFTRRDLPHA